ncbi:cardiolipin synthase [Mesobaculum littorinae]|uniref:cardiolipin synthase n=1 Tax=Mesobaculum littorinae TaxID=2486419 RepID=UPI0013E3B31A|nr:cardiolipin synthase [Mesobaculum littorinae]
MWLISFPIIAALTLLLAAFTAFRAMQTSRTPQGAVGWVVFIAALPFAAIPAYYIFGYARTGDYRLRRAVTETALSRFEPGSSGYAGQEALDRLQLFTALGGAPVVTGNGVELIENGQPTYDAIIDEIGRARTYLLVQYYTVRDDEAGAQLLEALLDAARRGVKVRMLYDPMGCFLLTRRYKRALMQGGVELVATRGPSRVLGRFGLNYRNHRKTVIVDGLVGFQGGVNVGNEYLGAWRDTHTRLTGPVVAQLQMVFAEDWAIQTDVTLDDELNWDPGRVEDGHEALVLGSGPTDRFETATLYFGALAHQAQRRLWLTTPYFVPHSDLVAALSLAALRGVDVRVMVPDRPDKWSPWIAAFGFFDEIRSAGVQVLRYDAGFMHQKVALVDDDLVSIGTINLDIRSCMLNYETTVLVHGEDIAGRVEAMLERDMKDMHVLEKRLDEQALWLRVAAPVIRLMAPVL